MREGVWGLIRGRYPFAPLTPVMVRYRAMRMRWFLPLIIWLALGLRLFALGAQSLWYDEGVTWYLTRFDLPALVGWTAADIQPPLYYLILWVSSRLFGQSEWALRFPSVCFGLLGAPLLWQAGRGVFAAWGRGQAEGVGLAAAAFIALSPLMVYYSQEARMYTLLVFQAALGSYLLWRIVGPDPLLSPPPARGRRWLATRLRVVGYVVVMASALYTHYFAAFLLLAHALYMVVVLGQAGWPGPLVGRSVALFGGVAALFAPWAPVLLARLGDDPSYWPGLLKLPEVAQDVAISFAVGGKREMIFEADGLPLAAIFGLLLLFSIAAIWLSQKKFPRPPWPPAPLLFLLLWLILPIALILLLSYQTPKFNPRYTMLAWPAFALLLAGGLGLLWRQKGGAARVGGALVVLFIGYSWAFSLRNWYAGEAFRRDDFKALAQFVRERSFHDEPVLLSSGHFFPVWQYYFGPHNWTPLPEMETLDVDRVTGFSVIPSLDEALAGQPGVWLVTWQDEVIDPNRVIPLLLDAIGRRTEDPLLIGDFIGVGLRYWRLPQRLTIPQPYPLSVPADVNFGNLVRLHGLWQSDEAEAEIALYWEALQPLTEDYLVSLRLLDADGVAWSDGAQVTRPGAYLYPALRWPPGEIVAGRQALPLLAGAPPGRYWLEIGWLGAAGEGIDVLDAGGNPQRRTVLLGPLRLTEPAGGLEASYPAAPGQDEAVGLLEAAFEQPAAEAGSKVTLDSIWRLGAESQGARLALVGWEDATGAWRPLPAPVVVDLGQMPPGTVFRSRKKLSTPPQASPGPATLKAQVTSAGGAIEMAPVAALALLPTERIFSRPQNLEIAIDASFSQLVTLLGADPDPPPLSPGQSTPLTLYWRADGDFEADYTVFAHLLGPDGRPVLNFDHAPPRPTSNWLEGEVIADAVSLAIPPNFPPGRYPLEVGLYNTADPNLARLPLSGGGDYIILTEIEVLPR